MKDFKPFLRDVLIIVAALFAAGVVVKVVSPYLPEAVRKYIPSAFA